MPTIIGEPAFAKRFNDLEQNKVDTEQFLLKGTKSFDFPGFVCPAGARFVMANYGTQFRLIMDTEDTPITIFMTRLESGSHITDSHKGMMEVEVWRDYHLGYEDIVKSLPGDFIRHLLQTFTSLVSDSSMTVPAIKYWKGLISWALESGYYVYAADGYREDYEDDNGRIEDTYIKNQIYTRQEFDDKYEAELFGKDDEKYSYRHVIVSLKTLE